MARPNTQARRRSRIRGAANKRAAVVPSWDHLRVVVQAATRYVKWKTLKETYDKETADNWLVKKCK